MKKLVAVLTITFSLLLPTQALAWNGKGHQTVAYIAYRNLTPQARQRVNKLLERHRDYTKLKAFAGSPTSSNYRLIIFMNAATWPDTLRDDARFYDETDPDAIPTKKIAGFPDMKKHRPWHFIDFAFADGVSEDKTVGPGVQNAQKSINAFRHAITNSPEMSYRAYFLSWLLHLVGDVHQPLHCIARFTPQYSLPDYPDGDRGGNRFQIVEFPVPEANYSADSLHSFWDGVLGTRRDISAIRTLGNGIMNEFPMPNNLSADENEWIRESFDLGRTVAYTLTPTTPNTKPAITPEYFQKTQKVARERVALAGYRMAALLNERFK